MRCKHRCFEYCCSKGVVILKKSDEPPRVGKCPNKDHNITTYPLTRAGAEKALTDYVGEALPDHRILKLAGVV